MKVCEHQLSVKGLQAITVDENEHHRRKGIGHLRAYAFTGTQIQITQQLLIRIDKVNAM